MRPPNRSRTAAAIAIISLTFVAVACGGQDTTAAEHDGPQSLSAQASNAGIEWLTPPLEIEAHDQEGVGAGKGAAIIVRPRPRQTDRYVIYLHGGTPLPPSTRAFAIERLTSRGFNVIYPAYRAGDDETDLEALTPRLAAAVESAAAELDRSIERAPLVGEGFGGTLALAYAATAGRRGAPEPESVAAIAPARLPLPRAAGNLSEGTRALVIALSERVDPRAASLAEALLARVGPNPLASPESLHVLPPNINVRTADGALLDRHIWQPIVRHISGSAERP